jgi:hypothetical protein
MGTIDHGRIARPVACELNRPGQFWRKSTPSGRKSSILDGTLTASLFLSCPGQGADRGSEITPCKSSDLGSVALQFEPGNRQKFPASRKNFGTLANKHFQCFLALRFGTRTNVGVISQFNCSDQIWRRISLTDLATIGSKSLRMPTKRGKLRRSRPIRCTADGIPTSFARLRRRVP